MNFKSVDRIMNAKEKGGAKKYILDNRRKIHVNHGVAINIKNMDKPKGNPVYAYVLRGMWVANCECNGCALVDPDELVYFCFSCLNRTNGGSVRPVIFPDNWQEIEKVLLERPVYDLRGLSDLDRAANAEPVIRVEIEEPIMPDMARLLQAGMSDEPFDVKTTKKILPLPRSWDVGETIEDLINQQEPHISNWKRKLNVI